MNVLNKPCLHARDYGFIISQDGSGRSHVGAVNEESTSCMKITQHVHIHTQIHQTYTHPRIYTSTPTCLPTYLPPYLPSYLPSCIHTYICYIHTYIYSTYRHTPKRQGGRGCKASLRPYVSWEFSSVFTKPGALTKILRGAKGNEGLRGAKVR